MMKLTCFIFILVYIHFLNGTSSIPELLECVNPSCKDTISTGRLIKSVKVVYGNLETVKTNTKVQIKGKSYGNENTLWLIELDGFYGFVDLSLIKEIKDKVRTDLILVDNPYLLKTFDETEKAESSINQSQSPSSSKIYSADDETENFSENNQSNNVEKLEEDFTNSNEIDASDVVGVMNEAPSKTDPVQLVNVSLNSIKSDTAINSSINNEKVENTKYNESNLTEASSVGYTDKIEIKSPKSGVNDAGEQSKSVANKIETFNQNEIKKASETTTKQENLLNTVIPNANDVDFDDKSNKTSQTHIVKSDKTEIKSSESDENDTGKPSEKAENKIEMSNQDNIKKDSEITTKYENLANTLVHDVNDVNFDKSGKTSQENIVKPDNSKGIEDTETVDNSKETTDRIDNTVPDSENKSNVKDSIITRENISNDQVSQHEKSNPDNKPEEKSIISVIMNGAAKDKIDDSQTNRNNKLDDYPKEVKENSSTPEEHKNSSNQINLNERTVHISKHVKTSILLDNGNYKTDENKPIDKSTKVLENKSEKQNEKIDQHQQVLDSVKLANSDPWLDQETKVDPDQQAMNTIKSPILRLILKLDMLSQYLLKSVTIRLGLDSSSAISRFTSNWLQMSLENFLFVLSLLVTVFVIAYTPKIFKLNRDWKSEFLRQSIIVAELDSKLATIEEVRHKLSEQNHNFEKVIHEYKEQIKEIQTDADNNKQTMMLEIAKSKKTHETYVKRLTSDLNNKVQQCNLFETDFNRELSRADQLELNNKKMESEFEEERLRLDDMISRLEKDIKRSHDYNGQLKNEIDKKLVDIADLNTIINDLNDNLQQKSNQIDILEKSFEHLKAFEGLDYNEFITKKDLCLDLSSTKDKLQQAENKITTLQVELDDKGQQIDQLQQLSHQLEGQCKQYELEKDEAVSQRIAAENKLQVLTDYFKSKEVEMAKSLGHQVIETNQTLDQVDYLKHRIQILESENGDLTKSVQTLKTENRDVQTFAARCKSEANEEINNLFLKNSMLERNLNQEKEENRKLRAKLSHYCGPMPVRNTSSSMNFNHHNKDRPPSRQSMASESSGFIPMPPLIPIPLLPQSPVMNSSASGRNSVNSKKSNNT